MEDGKQTVQATNRLGMFMRERRKELGKRLIDIAEIASVTPGYISKLELGQISDGPSLAAMGRLADALKVDVTVLTRLKEQDAGGQKPAFAVPPTDDESNSELRREYIRYFDTSGDRVRRNLVAHAQVSYSMLSDVSPPGNQDFLRRIERMSPVGKLESENSDASVLATVLTQVAEAYVALAYKLTDHRELAGALNACQEAEMIFRQAGNMAGAALSHFHMGRVYEMYCTDQPDDALYKLHKSVESFELAAKGFSSQEKLKDEYRERLPEALAKQAEMLLRMASVEMDHLQMGGGDDPDIVRQRKQQFYARYYHQAQTLRARAVEEYEKWIAELNQRPTLYGKWLHIMAEAHHRLGIVLRDEVTSARNRNEILSLPVDEDMQKMQRNTLASLKQFRQCVGWRQQLVRQHPEDGEDRNFYLNRLSNSHQEWGYTMHMTARPTASDQAVTDPEKNVAAYGQILYQYQIAKRLNEMYRPDYDPKQVEFLLALIDILQRDYDLGETTRTAINQRIFRLLEQADFTNLEYALEYPATGKQESTE